MQFLVFNKKRIKIVLLSIIISLSIIALRKGERTIETMAWIGETKTIVLDPGHGTPDEGDCLLTLIENN